VVKIVVKNNKGK